MYLNVLQECDSSISYKKTTAGWFLGLNSKPNIAVLYNIVLMVDKANSKHVLINYRCVYDRYEVIFSTRNKQHRIAKNTFVCLRV